MKHLIIIFVFDVNLNVKSRVLRIVNNIYIINENIYYSLVKITETELIT